MILVDSNVLLDVLTNDALWFGPSSKALFKFSRDGLAINPIIFAECSVAYRTLQDFESALHASNFRRLPLPYQAGFRAAKAFVHYRRRGGAKTSPLPDFYIGAHAEFEKIPILTRDSNRYLTYFPEVKLLTVTR